MSYDYIMKNETAMTPITKSILLSVVKAEYGSDIELEDVPNVMYNMQPHIAWALHTLVDHVVPEESKPSLGGMQPGGTNMYYHEAFGRWEERQLIRRRILEIANELYSQEEINV